MYELFNLYYELCNIRSMHSMLCFKGAFGIGCVAFEGACRKQNTSAKVTPRRLRRGAIGEVLTRLAWQINSPENKKDAVSKVFLPQNYAKIAQSFTELLSGKLMLCVSLWFPSAFLCG